MNIIITGANGFIGKELIKLFQKKNKILAVSQKRIKNINTSLTLNEFLDRENFSKLKNFQPTHFIHTAAIAHTRIKNNKDFLERAKFINQDLPLELFVIANKLGVKRFIFLSSIGVNGFRTEETKFFTENSKYEPYDKYTDFKKNAEISLINASRNLQTELIILRPTVVYGRNAPGNFQKLLKIVDYNLPFIVCERDNSRSILYIQNLVSAISKSLIHPIQSPQIFVLADKETMSTKDIIKRISMAKQKKILILVLPLFIFNFFKRFPFFRRRLSQLVDNLVVNSSLINKTMNWEQPFSQKDAFIRSFSKNIFD